MNKNQKLNRKLHQRAQKIANGKKRNLLAQPNYQPTQTATSGHSHSKGK